MPETIISKRTSIPEIKVFGNRVAIIEVNETLDGEIELPQGSSLRDYRIGKVISVGDTVKCRVKKDDYVLFQIPQHIMATAVYSYPSITEGPQSFAIVNADDMFGTLAEFNGNVFVNKNSFYPLGKWSVLTIARMQSPEARILLPETASIRLSDLHFDVFSVGDLVEGIEKGDRVFIERGRSTPIMFNGEELVIIHQDFVQGVEIPAKVDQEKE